MTAAEIGLSPLSDTEPSSFPIALYIMGCGVIGLIVVSMLKDHTGRDVSQEYEGM